MWETHLPECDDLAFIEAGINGSDYGTGGNYPVLHVCPVDASVVEGGKIDPLRDWRHIVNSTDSYGILDCICRKCAQTRGDAEMENFKRDHVWKEGESGEQFIKTCMVFGEYADWFTLSPCPWRFRSVASRAAGSKPAPASPRPAA